MPRRRAPRRLAALAAALAALGISAVPAAAATAGGAGHALVGTQQVAVEITSVSPFYARPKTAVTVSGAVTNPTNTAQAGLWLQLWSSAIPLASRSTMGTYLSTPGPTGLDQPEGVPGPVFSLAAHATRQFTLTLRPAQAGMRIFGVYPLAVQLSGPPGELARARTFLPYWPGKAETKLLKPVSTAWVWPLIDTPQQAACRALRTPALAASLAPGGRLNGLLAAGSTAAAQQAHLTWAIDPALLSDVTLMTGRYRIGVNPTCGGGTAKPPDPAARAWLSALKLVTAGQAFFVTPYADVDVAALAHRGLDGDLASAFTAGHAAAERSRILGVPQRTSPSLPGYIAWPPGGIADYGVLEDLIRNHVRTVLLSGAEMPPTGPALPYTPSDTTAIEVYGTRLHVLLGDPMLSQILAERPSGVPGALPAPAVTSPTATPPASAARGAAGGGVASRAATFARQQWFVAETAMIAAALPGTARSLVVMPPRRWNPPPGMAAGLLSETVHAPWLRAASLAGLATARHPTGAVPRKQPAGLRVSPSELRAPLLHQVRTLTGQIHLLGSILAGAGPHYLATAAAVIESSAWRGNAASQRRAEQILHDVSAYVRYQLQQVTIVHSVNVTLGGTSGSVPVSVRNNLPNSVGAIRVRLEVSVTTPGRVTIGRYKRLVTVAAGTQSIIKIPVRAAAAGSTTLTLRLATPEGRLLPRPPASLTVQATHFGTLAIVIIVVALVVFVFTAAGRAIRRGAEPGGDGTDKDVTNQPAELLEYGQALRGRPDPASGEAEADSVVSAGEDEPDAKEADDDARTPGQARRPL